jgi:hypothetical protein
MNFIDRKEPRKTLFADVDGSEKTFFKNVAIVSLDTPKNCRHAATFPCRPCRSWAVALQTLRHDRRNTNATFIFRVSLRRGGVGQNIDATPETLKYMGVAVLRIFWGECLIFCDAFENLSSLVSGSFST